MTAQKKKTLLFIVVIYTISAFSDQTNTPTAHSPLLTEKRQYFGLAYKHLDIELCLVSLSVIDT